MPGKSTLRNSYFLLAVIMILAAALRLFRLNFQSLWFDELIVMNTCLPVQSFADIIKSLQSNVHPPFYYLCLNTFFRIFEYSEFTARLLSAIIGILSIPLVYLLGKEIKNRETGLFAAFILSINYFHIYYSQEVRSYILLFFFSTLTLWLLVRYLKQTNLKNLVFYSVSAIFLIFTHYYGFILLAGQFILIVAYAIIFKSKQVLYFCLAIISVVVLSLILWFPVLLKVNAISDIWIPTPRPTVFFEYLYIYTGKDPMLTLLYLTLFFVFVTGYYRQYRENPEENNRRQTLLPMLFIAVVIVAYLLPYLRSIFSTPMLLKRYTIIVLPLLAVFAALGFSQLKNLFLKRAIILLVVISTTINFVFFNRYYTKKNKEDFRGVTEYVKNENVNKFQVFSHLSYYFRYYFQENQMEMPRDMNTLSRNELLALDGFWFVTAHNNRDVSGKKQEVSPEIAHAIDSFYFISKKFRSEEAEAIQYQKK